MRLKFTSRPVGGLTEYHGPGLNLRHGEEADVEDPAFAERLQRDFPGQFEVVAGAMSAAPMDRSVKSPLGRQGGRFRTK